MTELSLVDELRPLIEAQKQIARKAEAQYTLEVNRLIKEQCQDPQRIDWLLENLLTFCFDDSMLALYKKLCRYYYPINPQATASHVYAYRDMWEDDYEPSMEEHSL